MVTQGVGYRDTHILTNRVYLNESNGTFLQNFQNSGTLNQTPNVINQKDHQDKACSSCHLNRTGFVMIGIGLLIITTVVVTVPVALSMKSKEHNFQRL